MFVSEAVVFLPFALGFWFSVQLCAVQPGNGSKHRYIRAPSERRGDEDEEFVIPHFY